MEPQSSIKIWFRLTFLSLIILTALNLIAIYWSANVAFLNSHAQKLTTLGSSSSDFSTAGELFIQIETLNDYKNYLLYIYLIFVAALYLSFIIWFYKFQNYLRGKDVSFDYTNQWVGLVWFIPFVNLFYGSILLKDIWTKLSTDEQQTNWSEFLIYAIFACFGMPGLKILSYRASTYTDFEYAATQAGYSVMAYCVNVITIVLISIVLLKLTHLFHKYLANRPESNLMDHLTSDEY